jgi:hypothetical protein
MSEGLTVAVGDPTGDGATAGVGLPFVPAFAVAFAGAFVGAAAL